MNGFNMKNVRFSSVILVAIALVSAACSATPATPTSPSSGSGSLTLTASQLGGVWTLTTLQVAGQSAQPSPATYTLSLADGQVSTRADCNICNGALVLDGATLTAGPIMACTRAACPTMQFESIYESILSGQHTVALSGKTLTLSSARGRLTFTQ